MRNTVPRHFEGTNQMQRKLSLKSSNSGTYCTHSEKVDLASPCPSFPIYWPFTQPSKCHRSPWSMITRFKHIGVASTLIDLAKYKVVSPVSSWAWRRDRAAGRRLRSPGAAGAAAAGPRRRGAAPGAAGTTGAAGSDRCR